MAETHTNYTMKVLFCFGITFIVAGHVLMGPNSGGFSFGFNLFPPQGFHVAIFLFVAGYFYHPRHEERPLAFVKKKLLRLIVPLYALTWMYAVLTVVLHRLGFQIGADPSPYNLLLDPLLGGHAFWWNCPLWFVAPFFVAQMADFCLRLLLKVGESRRKEALLIVLYGIIGVVTTSVVIATVGREGFPEGTSNVWVLLARTGYFMPCLALGRLYRVFLEPVDSRIPNWLWFGACFALQYLTLVVCEGNTTFLVSWCAYYTGRFVPYLTTAVGIALWLRVSKLLAPALASSKSMNLVADSTFSIMAHQFLGFLLVKCVFAALASAGLIAGFDFAALHSNIWYYWFPEGMNPREASAFGTVYVVAGLLVPCGIHWCWERLKGKVRTLRG